MDYEWNSSLHPVPDDPIRDYVGDSMNEEPIVTNVYDECEVHENCTVEIWKNSTTGKISIGWYENNDKPKGEN